MISTETPWTMEDLRRVLVTVGHALCLYPHKVSPAGRTRAEHCVCGRGWPCPKTVELLADEDTDD